MKVRAELMVVFTAMLLISNVIVNSMIAIGPWTMAAGTLTFPITYILSDVFSEIYGYKWSRRVSYLAAGMNFVLAGFIYLAIILPKPDWYNGLPFAVALGNSWRIVIASIGAYVVGDWVNDRVFRRMRGTGEAMLRRTPGFAGRALISSAAGNAVDTILFNVAALGGVVPWSEIPSMCTVETLAKTAIEIALIPITIKVVDLVARAEI